ncbi:MAG TPA: LuxR C-terminal-related transcriptional regulator [Thermomicrobiales bacterium]|nr:LuxR C-terminal-related transcriptional regulator [Thermomicrobiales bacterium]
MRPDDQGHRSARGEGLRPRDAARDAIVRPLPPRARPRRYRPSAAPSQQRAAPARHLPLQPPGLVGRGDDLAEVRQLLLSGQVRLLTLTGPGGVGKTRLAVEVVSAVHAAFEDGACFVDLAPLADPARIGAAIGRALDLRDRGEPDVGALSRALTGRQLLLALDTFEHLLAAAPQVATLLAACSRLTVLVTSRAPLGLRWEHLFPVRPLAVPGRSWPGLAALAEAPAVALFLARARAVAPDFAPTAEDAVAFAEVCTRLDGLPLAIELAAARAKHLAPLALLARLDDPLGFLAGGPHDLPPRQQALRHSLAWSFDLLAPPEQLLFRRLAVFAGSFTLDAAWAVVATSGHVPLPLEDGLDALVDQNLLRQEWAPGGERRFSMLATSRAYAIEQLLASGEAEPLEEAHTRHYLALAEAAAAAPDGPDRPAWLARLGRERENLHEALRRALARGAAEVGLRLGGTLWPLWLLGGDAGDIAQGRAWLMDLLALPDADTHTAARPRALHGAGILARTQGDDVAARGLLEESLALYRACADPRGASAVLEDLAAATPGHGGSRAVGVHAGQGPDGPPAKLRLIAPARSDHEAALAGDTEAARRLTEREHDVARLIAGGLTNRQIADTLLIGERSVHSHVGSLLRKLELSSRTQVALWAVQHGLDRQPAPPQAPRRRKA